MNRALDDKNRPGRYVKLIPSPPWTLICTGITASQLKASSPLSVLTTFLQTITKSLLTTTQARIVPAPMTRHQNHREFPAHHKYNSLLPNLREAECLIQSGL